MSKLLVSIEILLSLILLNSSESYGENYLESLGNFGQCGLKIGNNEDFKKCKDKVTEDWKLETDVKRQTCCKPLSFLDCTLQTAKQVCNDNEYNQIEKAEKVAMAQADRTCVIYRETPSMCGTNAILPVLSVIVVSMLLVIRVS